MGMKLKQKFSFSELVYLFSIIYYLVIGIWVFCIFNQDFADNVNFFGVLIILSSVPHILIYAINQERKTYLIIGLVGLAFGILFIASDLFTPDQVCMIWGCIDICRGITEIIAIAPTLRKNKANYLEVAISVGDIVIGILLCIHLAGGLRLHLIYLAIEFVVTGIKNLVELIIERKNRNEGPTDN